MLSKVLAGVQGPLVGFFCFYANLGLLCFLGSFVDIMVLVRYAGSKELQSIPSRKMR